MLLAIDDTDSPLGGCTTHTAIEVVARLPKVVLRGMPRLVRLNPNCPHKTRGNGAVVLDLGLPGGPSTQVGTWRHDPVAAYPDADGDVDVESVLDSAWDVVQYIAADGSHPSVAASTEPLPEAAYWQAVQSRIDVADAEALLPAWRGGGQSLAGCLGALAWPGPASSHELIAYRTPERCGTPREVDGAPLRAVEQDTFHTFDGDRLACVPGSPCPVLAGLRGTDPEALRHRVAPALRKAAKEPWEGWMLWATNQASGDHVVGAAALGDAPEWATVRTKVTIGADPEWGAGGHVQVPATAADGACTLWAFEPTKAFRHDVARLIPGDVVDVTGRLDDRAIHLESMQIVKAENRRAGNPMHCGRSMQSRGRGAGFRCKVCREQVPESAAPHVTPTGAFEVPVSARRHLHRPLAWRG